MGVSPAQQHGIASCLPDSSVAVSSISEADGPFDNATRCVRVALDRTESAFRSSGVEQAVREREGLAYSIGARPKASSVDISRDVGLTIFWASLGVLAIHAAFSFVEF